MQSNTERNLIAASAFFERQWVDDADLRWGSSIWSCFQWKRWLLSALAQRPLSEVRERCMRLQALAIPWLLSSVAVRAATLLVLSCMQTSPASSHHFPSGAVQAQKVGV